MGQIVYETATSFDGYIADEQNALSWLFAVPGGDDPTLAPPKAAVQVMGSTTYEWVLAELDALQQPEAWAAAFGTCHVAVQFLEAEALNQLVFTIAPVALGRGAPLLPMRIESDRLTLIAAQQVGQFARLTYEIS